MNFYLLVLFWSFSLVFLYSNVFYPLLFAFLGRQIGRSCSLIDIPDELLKPITLLVPAYNEKAVIAEKLSNIDRLEYPKGKLTVFVASDGSSDGTQEIVLAYNGHTPLKLLDFAERRGKASVVNDAIEQCGDEWICLCDANVMFRPDALIRLGNRLKEPGVGAVTGDVRLASNESDFGRGESLYYAVERAIQRGESRIGSVMGVDGGMYLLKRKLFQPLSSDTILDDFTISMRVIQQGYRIQYEPTAVADENGTPSSEIEFGRRKRVARGAVQSITRGVFPSLFGQPIEFLQWFSHKFLRWLNPFFAVGIVMLSFILAYTNAWMQVLLAVELSAIALALLAWFIPRLRELPILGVLYYLGLSYLAMFIGFLHGFTGRYSAIWSRTERKLIEK
jgi:biofilm PGA synthesis N-glycosyltransferase PgaC